MNLGLSDELKLAFPGINLVSRPLLLDTGVKDPNWLAGLLVVKDVFSFLYLNLLIVK